MYAIAIIRDRKPLDEVLKLVDDHRAYLRGAVDATLAAVRDGDPFVKNAVGRTISIACSDPSAAGGSGRPVLSMGAWPNWASR